jgi:hypothetical protein
MAVKGFLAAFAIMISAACAWGLESGALGQVEYIEGSASFSRDGNDPAALDFGSPIHSGDLVKTGANGRIVIALDKTSGFSGSLTINANTIAYIDLDLIKGEPHTVVDLISGSIGARLRKIAGSPSMQVQTASAIAGVRGTEFEVATSVNDAVLVTCTDGEVSCEDDSGEITAVPAGKALEKRGAGRPRFLDVKPGELGDYGQRWAKVERDAFLADPMRIILAYEKQYSELSSGFQSLFGRLQSNAALKAWIDDDRRGRKISLRDPALIRQKKDILDTLKDLRHDLFLFERVYSRMDEIREAVQGTDIEARELRRGFTVGDFFRRFEGEKTVLDKQIGVFHYAQRLFMQRDDGSSGLFSAPPPRKDSHFLTIPEGAQAVPPPGGQDAPEGGQPVPPSSPTGGRP